MVTPVAVVGPGLRLDVLLRCELIQYILEFKFSQSDNFGPKKPKATAKKMSYFLQNLDVSPVCRMSTVADRGVDMVQRKAMEGVDLVRRRTQDGVAIVRRTTNTGVDIVKRTAKEVGRSYLESPSEQTNTRGLEFGIG